MALAADLLLDASTIETRAQEVDDANERLAQVSTVPLEVAQLIEALVAELVTMPEREIAQMDPYLLLALQRGALAAQAALLLEDNTQKRRQLRVALEQVRQAFRDFNEAYAVDEDRSAKDVARWLAETVSVPQATWATLVGTTARTFQRWISSVDNTRPQGEEERRLRIIARIVNHLRHAVTGAGAVNWFQRPRDELGGLRPLDLLDDPDSTKRLLTIASRTRSSNAA
jgi:uncharacterized protein (DUF2384 family)